MAAYAFFIPILPGQEEAHRQFLAELNGPRRAEYDASHRRLGMQRERIWRQSTPQGTFAVVYIEADDPGKTFAGAASSTDPFDVWWRERILAVHGLDFSQPMPGPLNEQVLDWSVV